VKVRLTSLGSILFAVQACTSGSSSSPPGDATAETTLLFDDGSDDPRALDLPLLHEVGIDRSLPDGDASMDVPVDRGATEAFSDAVPDDGPMRCLPDDVTESCAAGSTRECLCADCSRGTANCTVDAGYGPCICGDAGVLDSDPPPIGLPPRLLFPRSLSRETVQRPTLRWAPPPGGDRVRIQVCGDRPCTRVLADFEATGSSARVPSALPPGVAFWHVQGLADDGGVSWSSATWSFQVPQVDHSTESSFGTYSDFDGDGFDDFFVSLAPLCLGSSDHARQVYIYRGSRGVIPTVPTWHTAFPEGTGIASMMVSDFDGDGRSDLAVLTGPCCWSLSAHLRGHLQVIYGRDLRLDTPTVVPTEVGVVEDPWTCVNGTAAVGDINGDGYGDLIGSERSEVVVDSLTGYSSGYWLGGARGLVSFSTTRRLDGPGYYMMFGDLNDDGYSDLFHMSAHRSFTPGSIRVLYGAPAPWRDWRSVSLPYTGPFFPSAPGQRRVSMDWDRDGRDDVAWISHEGTVEVFAAGTEGSPVRSIATVDSSDHAPEFRYPLSTAFEGLGLADTSGDGIPELLLSLVTSGYRPDGSPLPSDENLVASSFVLQRGGPGEMVEVRRIVESTANRETALANVHTWGDLDGDGRDELAFGTRLHWLDDARTQFTPGYLRIYRGSMGLPYVTINHPQWDGVPLPASAEFTCAE
jgi:hypothetical protein